MIAWQECERISDAHAVDESLRGFLEDPTGDNATMVVRGIILEYQWRGQQDHLGSYERWCDELSERLENYHGCVAFLLAVVAILALLR